MANLTGICAGVEPPSYNVGFILTSRKHADMEKEPWAGRDPTSDDRQGLNMHLQAYGS